MKPKHLAGFLALFLFAFAARETFQHCGGLGIRLGDLAAANLGAEAIEKVGKGFEIVVHYLFDAPLF